MNLANKLTVLRIALSFALAFGTTLWVQSRFAPDALAAQVGGLGLAPGVNMSDSLAFYEATHGTAPTIAGQDKANPGSVILCGALMLEQLGVPAAAERIRNAVSKAIAGRAVTVDLAAQVEGARVVGCQEFGEIIGACL